MSADKLAEARATIDAEKRRVTEACWAEIQAVLKKHGPHGCELSGTPELIAIGGGAYATVVKLWVSARED